MIIILKLKTAKTCALICAQFAQELHENTNIGDSNISALAQIQKV